MHVWGGASGIASSGATDVVDALVTTPCSSLSYVSCSRRRCMLDSHRRQVVVLTALNSQLGRWLKRLQRVLWVLVSLGSAHPQEAYGASAGRSLCNTCTPIDRLPAKDRCGPLSPSPCSRSRGRDSTHRVVMSSDAPGCVKKHSGRKCSQRPTLMLERTSGISLSMGLSGSQAGQTSSRARRSERHLGTRC